MVYNYNLLTFYSGILSGIYSDILSGILCGTYTGIFSIFGDSPSGPAKKKHNLISAPARAGAPAGRNLANIKSNINLTRQRFDVNLT